MNLVMDKEGIQRAWGGPVQGSIADGPRCPTRLMPELTADTYAPYQTAPFAGDVEAAKEEMKLSKYDTDKDGICDAAACKGIVLLNRNFAPWSSSRRSSCESAAQDRHRAEDA